MRATQAPKKKAYDTKVSETFNISVLFPVNLWLVAERGEKFYFYYYDDVSHFNWHSLK